MKTKEILNIIKKVRKTIVCSNNIGDCPCGSCREKHELLDKIIKELEK